MSETAATRRLSKWLSVFGQALKRGDAESAALMFAKESYWRDLLAFTWNIKTAEGRDAIAAMLETTLASARPENWRLDGEASEADGVTEGWFTFETHVARGHGHLRLKGDKCWTLLTAMTELKGHEEKAGPTREKGVEHGSVQGAAHLARPQDGARRPSSATSASPICLIVGGGQGGIGLGARLKRLGVPTLIIDKHERPGDQWRKRYKSLCLHDPVWYDHLPYLPFPGALAGVLAQGQDRRLARDVHQGHGAQLLALDRVQERALRREAPRMDREGQARRQSRSRCGRSSSCSRPACRACRTCRSSPARDASRACSTIRAGIRAARPTKARNASSSAPTIRRTTSAPISASTAPM